VHRLLLPAAAACAVVAGTTIPSPPAQPAAAAEEHRAVVIVDTGQEVRRICVRFAEDFLTGQELLIRARTDPVFRQYSGLGAAVCALCGVGCPADESCLTCGGDDHWAYSRAPKGTTTFRLSGGGASSTKVYDGDVEGWRWSNGLLPAYSSVDQVCGPAPDSTTTTASSGGVTATSPTPAPTTTTTATRRTTTTREAARVAGSIVETTTTTPPAGEPSTTTTSTEPTDEAAPPTVPRHDDHGSGSLASMLGFATALAALLRWGVRLRRRRSIPQEE
jgi:hypothetical protein